MMVKGATRNSFFTPQRAIRTIHTTALPMVELGLQMKSSRILKVALVVISWRTERISIFPKWANKATELLFKMLQYPLLGIVWEAYIPETVVAHVLSDTGRDLFRLTGLVREMTLSPQYLDVLRSFRRRIAYANAHNTDFQVPTNTAAFLCKHSRYPHTFVEEENKDDTTTTTSWMAGTFYTKKVESDLYEIIHKYSSLENPMDTEGTDQLELSLALDSLGWKKVFVDVRDLLPLSIPIPFVKEPKLVNHYQKEKSEGGLGTMESRQIIPFVSSSNRISFPNGHTTMVANSKSDFVAWLNSNGRIIMNQFAAELVNDMLSWSPE